MGLATKFLAGPPVIASASPGSHGDLAACTVWIVENLLAAPEVARTIVMNRHAKAWAKCEAKAPLAKATWDETRVMRLRSLAVNYPNNDDLAKAMGLSVRQIQRARSRFADKRMDSAATPNDAKRA